MKNLCFYDVENFGDALSKILFRLIYDNEIIKYNDLSTDYYLFLGSLIHPKYVNKNCTICGAGFISDKINLIEKPKKIISVRGLKSYQKLNEPKNVKLFGDPAIFTSELIEGRHSFDYKVGIIPHYVDYDIISKEINNPNILIINPKTKNSIEIISKILSSELIISSSLHGVIVGHSYNIPSLWCEFSNKVIGDGFKFFDYFSSVGIEDYRITINNDEIHKLNSIEYIKKIFYKYSKNSTIDDAYFNKKNYLDNLKNEINGCCL
jgi:hypothetical protein